MDTQSAKADFGEGIYTPEWNERTYGECLKRAEALLLEGGRVVVDASFREEANRMRFVELAEKLGVPCRIMVRTAPDEVIKAQLDRRSESNVSDADWQISHEAAKLWEDYSEQTAPLVCEVEYKVEKEQVISRGMEILRGAGLA